MKNNIVKIIGRTVLMFLVISTLTFLVSAQDESKNESRGGGRFEGTWDVQVTVRNCQTGAAITTFPAMGTFMSGGTALVSEAGIPSALKTPAHGVWSHIMGNTYRFKTKAFNFNASGNFTGWTIINNEANLNRSADEFTSAGVAEVYAANGNLLFTGCSTLAATRFE